LRRSIQNKTTVFQLVENFPYFVEPKKWKFIFERAHTAPILSLINPVYRIPPFCRLHLHLDLPNFLFLPFSPKTFVA